MFVCGALGRGKKTSIGACNALPFVIVAAIVRVEVVEGTRGILALIYADQARTSAASSAPALH